MHGSRTIYWNPTSGLILGDRKSVQSAAMGLAHEMGHAGQHLDFGDAEYRLFFSYNLHRLEELNMNYVDTPIALQLGEPVRGAYNDAVGFYDMPSSTAWGTLVQSHYWWRRKNNLNTVVPSINFNHTIWVA